MAKSASQLLNSLDIPSLDLGGGPVYVDIGWLADAEHRTGFRLIFERLLRDNREILEPLQLVAVVAHLPLDPRGSALSKLPVKMGDVINDASQVSDVLYDSHNEQVEFELKSVSAVASLHVSFDNPEFRLSWHGTAA